MSTRLRHIIFWTVIFGLWTYMKTTPGTLDEALLMTSVNLPFFMSIYYLTRKVLIPRFYLCNRTLLFINTFLFTTLSISGIWYFLASLIEVEPFQTLQNYFLETVQLCTPAAALLAWDIYTDWTDEQKRIQLLEKEKISSELKFLKAQLNPHFLFNTLNNLYSFVINKSSKAPKIIEHLSGLLDYAIHKSKEHRVTLQEEFVAIEHFVELEKIRYGERLNVTYDTKGDFSQRISPLLLLSIVENAFKHGASGDIENSKIKIDLEGKGQSIRCNVWNTKRQYVGETNDDYKEGIGLSNIKRQLNLIYPNLHEMSITEDEHSFDLRLRIQSNNSN